MKPPHPQPRGTVHERGFEPYLAVLDEQARLLESLAEVLVQQRAAVAASDAAALDASVGSLGRVLELLDAARAQAAGMATRLGANVDEPLDRLAARFGPSATAPVAPLQQRLRRAARAASREAAINRRVLRGAMEAGEMFLQKLFGDAVPTYAADPETRRNGRAGAVIDRRV